jgi:hypothetical protein
MNTKDAVKQVMKECKTTTGANWQNYLVILDSRVYLKD